MNAIASLTVTLAVLLSVLPAKADDADVVLLARRTGTVEFQHGAQAPWRGIIASRVLTQNDNARTGDDSAAAINFTAGGRAFMDADALVQVNSGAPDGTRLTVMRGKVRVELEHAKPGTYVFRTATSQMAVRGTDFAFYEDAKRVEIGVYEGIVDATVGGEETTIPTWHGVIYDKRTKTLTQLAVGAIHQDFTKLYTPGEFSRDRKAARDAGLIP